MTDMKGGGGWTKPLSGSSQYFSLTFDLCLCFSLSLRRVYVINKEVCVRTVCAHEELLRGGFTTLYMLFLCVGVLKRVIWTPLCVCVCSADLCRDQFSRCGVAALSGGCSSLGGSCGKSCGGCWSSTDIRDATCPHTAAFSTTLPHPLTLSSCSSPQFSPQCAFSCTTHYSCAKSTSPFDFLFLLSCLSFYTCVRTNILQRTLMIVWITGAIKSSHWCYKI